MNLARFVRNIFSTYFATAISLISGVVITPLLVRHLPLHEYGMIALGLAIVAALEAVDFGVSVSLMRFVSDLTERGDLAGAASIVSTGFAIAMTVSALLCASVWLVESTRGVPGSYRIVAVLSIALVFRMPVNLIRSVLFGQDRFILGNRIDAALSVARMAAIYLAVLQGSPAIVIAWVLVGMEALAAVVGMIALQVVSPALAPRFRNISAKGWKAIRAFSSLAFVEDLLRRNIAQLPSFLTARLVSIADAGTLTVGSRFPQALGRMTVMGLNVSYPMITAAHSRNDEGLLRRYLVIGTRTVLTVLLVPASVLYVWAHLILDRWIGRELPLATSSLRWTLLLVGAAALQEVPLNYQHAIGKLRVPVVQSAVLACFALVGGAMAATRGFVAIVAVIAVLQTSSTLLLFRHALRHAHVRVLSWLRQGAIAPIAGSFFAAGLMCLARHHRPSSLMVAAASACIATLCSFWIIERLTIPHPAGSLLRRAQAVLSHADLAES